MRTFVCAILAVGLIAGCVAAEKKPSGPPPGRAALAALREGMSRDDVIARLGRPTAAAQVSTGRAGEFYESLTYVNTVVDGAVVELLFAPRLDQIRIDTKVYRDFSD
jgi:hypothetical protein